MTYPVNKSDAVKRKHEAKPVGQRRIPARVSTVLLASAMFPVLALTGCASHSERDFTVGSVQSTYKTKHPIIIDEKEKVLDIPVASSTYDLTTPSAGAIQGFADGFKDGANGVVTVMIPSGSANESAARALVPKIVEALSKEGIPSRRVRSTTYYAGEHGSSAPIRLSYSAVNASVEECGKWTEDLAANNGQNQNYHNFGCAYQNNIASMIANPADLIAPRGMSPVDAERRNKAIETYREGTDPYGTETVFN